MTVRNRSQVRFYVIMCVAGVTFGGVADIPVPADYNGDGETDISALPKRHLVYCGQVTTDYKQLSTVFFVFV